MTKRAWLVALALVASASLLIRAQQPVHVLMISIDGLMPSSYVRPGTLKIPTLARLAREGAFAEGVIGVLPTVTYPSHTTLITGVPPAAHGIVDNRILDPENRSNRAWFWYARDIKAPTLVGAVRARGLRAAAVSWPVSVGMAADFLVPEFQRSAHPESLTLLRALSTPHLIDGAELARRAPLGWPFTDQERTELAAYIIRTYQPHLTLLHLIDLDGAQHANGPSTPQAAQTLERIDGHVARLLDALREAGVADSAIVAIVSDHGFLRLERQLQPNALFRQEGLLTVDESGRITDWQAYFHSSGGSGFVYLKDRKDAALRERVGKLLERIKADPTSGVETVWSAADLARAGAHPEAAFGLDARDGFYTGAGHDALVVAASSKGGHGFAPARPALHASLILHGAPAKGRGSLGVVRMTQIAPTIAGWFGVGLAPSADRRLELGPGQKVVKAEGVKEEGRTKASRAKDE